ncbi:hypothetical protein V8G54_013195 [Vigna mungo]|uniref:DNA-directed RNA polymerases II and IV subunit 5A n=1 Tax=Vigna mungo TaxID=3915 RepID=A0AAQ3NT98_VIGMU
MVLPNKEISRLYRIRKTVMQMLRDRGYLVEDFEINMSKHEFKSKYGKHMKREDLVINKKDNSGDQIYVFFPEEAMVNIETMVTYIRRMMSEKVFRAILVIQTNLTSFARKSISEISYKIHFEVFQVAFPFTFSDSFSFNHPLFHLGREAELLVNIKEHELVPEHHVLTDTEKKTLTEKLRLVTDFAW